MGKQMLLAAFSAWLAATNAAADIKGHMDDDPLLTKVMVDRLEIRNADAGDRAVWKAEGWAGRDMQKLWIKTEGGRIDGRTDDAEVQLLYDRAVAPYWDLQAGWRGDFRPAPDRHWFALGFRGLAPYFFDIDTTLFIGDGGRAAFRLDAGYELMITQRLILAPELEANFLSKDDPAVGAGSGLSDLQAGLRMRYEIVREFAPYVGVNWGRKFGSTADLARDSGSETGDTQLLVGLRAWF